MYFLREYSIEVIYAITKSVQSLWGCGGWVVTVNLRPWFKLQYYKNIDRQTDKIFRKPHLKVLNIFLRGRNGGKKIGWDQRGLDQYFLKNVFWSLYLRVIIGVRMWVYLCACVCTHVCAHMCMCTCLCVHVYEYRHVHATSHVWKSENNPGCQSYLPLCLLQDLCFCDHGCQASWPKYLGSSPFSSHHRQTGAGGMYYPAQFPLGPGDPNSDPHCCVQALCPRGHLSSPWFIVWLFISILFRVSRCKYHTYYFHG